MALARLLFEAGRASDEARAELEDKLVSVAREMGIDDVFIVKALMSGSNLVFYEP